MKKIAFVVGVVALVAVVIVVNTMRQKENVEPIVWYGMAPHPYITEVASGAERAERETGVKVLRTVGQQWTQENENINIEALSTKGHKGFSIYPGDPAGANALFSQLKSRGQLVVAYGAEPNLPTPVPFLVATDIKGAAMAATEKLIEFMGGKGRILNVLETVTDINTKKRDDGIKEIVARHPGVEIIQTISDMIQVSEATTKIQSALAARANEIDGIIATGYNPTIAAAAVLTEWHKTPSHRRIRFIGIDTGPTVLQAIRDGYIDATVAQNPPCHGYISCMLLTLMLDGWKPRNDYRFIDAGIVVVTKANIDTYAADLHKVTEAIAANLKISYLIRPQ
jgi:ribose transport system substrate-binding protein